MHYGIREFTTGCLYYNAYFSNSFDKTVVNAFFPGNYSVMDLRLTGKVFIVTGGSKGIGAGISRSLAAEGAIPVIATRSVEATQKMLDDMKAQGQEAEAVIGDLQLTENCERVVKETVAMYGKIDGIVNNAGMNDSKSLEAGPAEFRNSLKINLFHYYDLVHFALPWLKKSKGVILNVSSKVAFTGQGNTSGYAAAKAAQLGLTRDWAAELLPYSIRVNALLPAEVMTPLYRNWLDRNFEDPEAKEKAIKLKIPLEKRMTRIEEMAATAVFLLSERSSHTTGQFIFVDGGYVHLDRALT